MENKKEEQKKDFQQTKYYCDQTQDLHNVMVLANNEQGGFVILQEVKHPDYKNSARTFVVYRNKHSVRKHFGMGNTFERKNGNTN